MTTVMKLRTTAHNSTHNITEQIRAAVADSGVQDGLCVVCIPHTTAALTITSFWDEAGLEDIQDALDRLVPTRIDFKHQFDTPRDAAGHIKSAIVGVTMTLIVENGALKLGGSQGVYFLEFDGPRDRKVFVKAIGG